MKSENQIKVQIGITQARIDDLLQQKEENSSKGNWTVVNAIKVQLVPLHAKKQWLEWVLNDEES